MNNKHQTRSRILWLLLSVTVSGLVAFLLLLPGTPKGQTDSWPVFETIDRLNLDKLGHFGMNFALAFVYWGSLVRFPLGGRMSPWIAGAFALIYTGSLEWYQEAIPGRAPTLSDLGANIAGVLLFVGLVSLGVFRRFSR